MLPAGARLRRRPEFAATVRAGSRRTGRSSMVVVHLLVAADQAEPADAGPARAGFVVARAVGGAVVRNRVRRRLRHLVASRLDELPRGSSLVVRALPPSARASSADLGHDLDEAVRGALAPSRAKRGRTADAAGSTAPPVSAAPVAAPQVSVVTE